MGPEVAVLIGKHLDPCDIQWIDGWTYGVARLHQREAGVWDLVVDRPREKSSRFFGRRSTSIEIVNANISVIPFADHPDSHLGIDFDPVEFSRSLPYRPREVISIGTTRKSSTPAHLFIAKAALAFADRFDSLIDTCGVLVPYTEQLRFQTIARPDSPRYEELISDYMSKLPGTFFNIKFDEEIYTQIVDSVFLEAWTSHPDFSMVT